MDPSNQTELLERATAYAKAGHYVVQLHYVADDGGCSCNEPGRLDPRHAIGKHPVRKGWQKLPQMSPADVFSIWGEEGSRPWNVGLATGHAFFALDFDPDKAKEGAPEFAERVQADHEPATITGSGGLHWFFALPDFEIGGSSGRLPKGFDVRGIGGQVVVAPSVSAKGPYISTSDIPEIHEAPEYLLDLVRPLTEAPEISESDRKEYDSLSGEKRARVDRYVNRAVSRIEGKLRDLRDVPIDEPPHWDETVFKLACDLLEIARSPWNGYSEKDAYASLFSNAPRDGGFDDTRVNKKFESAVQKTAGKSRPAPDWVKTPEPIAEEGKKVNPDEIPLEDARLVEFIALDLRKTWRWSAGLGWLKWDGKRWKAGRPDPEPRNAVREWVIRLLRRTKDGGRIKQITPKLTAGAVGSLTNLLRGVEGILADAEDFDADPDILNCTNGVVDLRTGEIMPHSPDRLVTKISGIDYRPGYTHPDWEKAKEALPEEVLGWLRIRMGQAITGHTPPDDMMVICQGGGENGKSSIMEPISRALGEFYVLVSDRVLLASNDAHPTELMDLKGARFALLEETPEARRLNVTRMKKLIGTPRIRARYIAKDSVSWDATHTLFINTNYVPQVDETDRGTWRRLALLTFPYSFRKSHESLRNEFEKYGDPGLRDRLKENPDAWAAALAWAVSGAIEWYSGNRVMPAPPEAVERDTMAWRSETDVILAFFTDTLVPDPRAHVASSDLLDSMNTWLAQRGAKPWSDRLLAGRLASHDIAKEHRLKIERVRSTQDGLSRPAGLIKPDAWSEHGGLAKPLPSRFRAWFGLAFRDGSTPNEDESDES